jgi:hypothetical protein
MACFWIAQEQTDHVFKGVYYEDLFTKARHA